MGEENHFKRMSFLTKTMIFVLFLITVSSTLFAVAHMSWLGSMGSLFETVGPDDFKATDVTMKQDGEEFVYKSTFFHQGITDIDTSRITVNISIVSSSGNLRQFNPSVQKSKTRFGEYTVILDGFLSTEKVEKVDEADVIIRSPRELDNVSVCILYSGTPVACSGENEVSSS